MSGRGRRVLSFWFSSTSCSKTVQTLMLSPFHSGEKQPMYVVWSADWFCLTAKKPRWILNYRSRETKAINPFVSFLQVISTESGTVTYCWWEFARFYPTSTDDEREGPEGLIALVSTRFSGSISLCRHNKKARPVSIIPPWSGVGWKSQGGLSVRRDVSSFLFPRWPVPRFPEWKRLTTRRGR